MAYLGIQHGRQAVMADNGWKTRGRDITSFYELFGAEIEYNLTEGKNPIVVVYGSLAAAIDAAFHHAPSNEDAMFVITSLLNKKLEDLTKED